MPSEYQAQFTGPEEDYDFAMGSVNVIRTFSLHKAIKTAESLSDDTPPTEIFALRGHWQQPWTDGENVSRCLRYTSALQLDVACREVAKRFGLTDLTMTELKQFLGLNKEHDLTAWQRQFPEYKHTIPLQARTTEYGFMIYEYLDPCDSRIPFAECSCGFYGAYELQPYFEIVHDYAAVVQHYGKTLIGTKGVRSTKARILAVASTPTPYEPSTNYQRLETNALQKTYPSVEFFTGSLAIGEMLRKYPITRP